MAKVDTLPELYRPLMRGTSVILDHCAVCGRTWPLNQHHVVKRSAGNLYRQGVKLPKPTITLCGSGNASGCHGLAHQGRLHFRWVVTPVPAMGNWGGQYENLYTGVANYKIRTGGHWEYLITDEPTKYQKALEMEGWESL